MQLGVLLFAVILVFRVNSMVIGCASLCGVENAQCMTQCADSIRAYTNYHRYSNRTYPLTAVPIFRLENDIDITGGDIFTYVASGMQILTSRDGRLFRFLPNPKPDQRVMTEIYQIPEELNLDTTANKGLYDITFPKNFRDNQLMYLSFAMSSSDPRYDHYNVVGEFTFNYRNMAIEFVQIVHKLPQTMSVRSGGFLKVGKTISDADYAPIWTSSGGNPEASAAMSKSNPQYSSIYSIYPESIKPSNRRYKELHGDSIQLWAKNLKNPVECDYASLRESHQIYCLDERYDENGRRSHVGVQGLIYLPISGTADADSSSTTSTSSSSQYTTTDAPKLRVEKKIYSPVYQLFYQDHCLPDSLVYSFDNLLPTEYRRRVVIAIPTCAAENFNPPRLLMLARSSQRATWQFVNMPVDMGEELLVNFHLLGTERSRGLFFIATQINTGYRDIYQIKTTDMYTSETGSVTTESSSGSWWSTT